MSDEDEDSYAEDCWDILERCHKQFVRLCRRSCRGRYDLVNEMMGVVVDRVPDVVDTWDPTEGTPLRAHVFINVRWYLWKWMNKRMRTQVVGFEPLVADPPARDNAVRDSDDKEAVAHLLDKLEDWEAEVVEMHHLQDMSFGEIAEELGLTRPVVRNRYMAAFERLKEIANGR